MSCFIFMHIPGVYLTGHNISTHQKIQIAEAYNNFRGLKEEEEFIQTEMMQFISTFKEMILMNCVPIFKVYKC